MTPLDGLGWMAGVWRGDVWGGVMEEHWTEPSGSTMLGLNRVVKDGRTVHREFLAIESREECIVMTVLIARNLDGSIVPTQFTLADIVEHRAVFVNPEHERLSKITYALAGASMRIRLEGQRNGAPFVDSFELVRQKTCENAGILLP